MDSNRWVLPLPFQGQGLPLFWPRHSPGHVQSGTQSELYPEWMFVEQILDGASTAEIETVSALSGVRTCGESPCA